MSKEMINTIYGKRPRDEFFYYTLNDGDGHFRFRSDHNFEGVELALEHAYIDSKRLQDVQVISILTLDGGLVKAINVKENKKPVLWFRRLLRSFYDN